MLPPLSNYWGGPPPLLTPMCTSPDNQKWIFNTKGQLSVKTESMVIFVFLFTSSDGAGCLYKIS